MTKKIIGCSLILITIFTLCGCDSQKEQNTNKKSDNVIKCTRNATANDAKTTLNYEIYYDGDYVTKTISIEKITTSNQDTLKTYQDAYSKVFDNYKGLDYYDNTISRTEDSIICTTIIDYEHVDTSKILAIEGEEGNIFDSDGKVKKETLLEFYKKYGANCE